MPDVPATPEIDAIIFDLGQVIVDWNPRYLLAEIERDEEALRVLTEEVLDLDWFRHVDAGYPLAKAIRERAALYPDYADALQVYVERWPETIRGVYGDVVAIVECLRRAGFRMYVLSNWARETWAMVHEGFDFLRHFDDIVISGHVGLAKPDPKLFDLARDRFEVTPQATLFIDDNERNVVAARDYGFRAIHFVSASRLREELAVHGIRIEAPAR